MMNAVRQLWSDEAGFIVSSELILIATVLVIGLLAGLTTIRDQVVQELGDVADAFSELNQSFSYTGVTGHSSSVAGSVFLDLNDFCESDVEDQQTGGEPQCLGIVGVTATAE